MIEVKFAYYHKLSKSWIESYKYFSNVNNAVRFMYVCKNRPNLHYSGEFSCDNQWDTEEIERRFK